MAAFGGVIGVALGALGFAAFWAATHPGQSLAEGFADLSTRGLFAGAAANFTLVGGLAGFLVAGLLVRNRLVVGIMTGIGRTIVIALATACGAGVSLGGYIGLWLARHQPATLTQGLEHARAAVADRHDPILLFLLIGAVAGTVIGLYAAGGSLVRRGARMLAGGLVGALAGLTIFCVAFVIIFYPSIPNTQDGVEHLATALYSFSPAEFLFVGIAAAAGALLSRYAWRLYGILTIVSLLFVVLGYILYTTSITLPAVPPDQAWLSDSLFAAELASLLMVLLYSFYTIDVAARKHWRRTTEEAMFSPYYLPKVAIHVPTYNEPPDLVIGTLQRLLDLDYPEDRFIIMVGDDSTDDACRNPLRAFCKGHGVAYLHRRDRSGYKAGALNMLLRQTPPDANLVAVVDADYHVEPEFLRATVGFFVDPELGWLQTPQDYRNRHQSFLTEQYYLADAYFYRTILPSRNEENSIIFCGTMGMLRKRAVQEVGGWGEKYITEDAELSVRLLNAGWRSLYVNKTYGRGLIPPTFEGYKRQHYRWAFGGGRILRGHGLRFLFGRFTFRQRLDYLVGNLNWFEGAFIFAISLFVLGMGVADAAGLEIVTHHTDEVMLVGLVPLFLLLDGLTRVHFVLRRSINLGFGGTLRILGMWFSVKFSNTRAALKAFLGFSIPFLRTPKAPTYAMRRGEAFRRALRITIFESVMAILLLLTCVAVAVRSATGNEPHGAALAVGHLLLGFWLVYYALLFSAAPLYAYKSFVSTRPQDGAPVLAAGAVSPTLPVGADEVEFLVQDSPPQEVHA